MIILSGDLSIEIPITQFLILRKNGTPLFARLYQKGKKSMNDATAVLLAGFFSAIHTFSATNLKTELKEIGLEDQRFLFLNTKTDLILTVAISEKNSDLLESLDNYKHSKSILEQASMAISLIEDISRIQDLDIGDLLEGFGVTLDTIILESSIEIEDLEESDKDFYFETSKSLNSRTEDIDKEEIENRIKELSRFDD